MGKNVIILTSGLSGSSVLTSLIVRAGFWPGDDTHKKQEYDTYENSELVQLNQELLAEAGLGPEHQTKEFSPGAIEKIRSLYGKFDTHPYVQFLKKCEDRRPWIWKDPRLWLTIRFWKNLLDLDDCRFILLTRDHAQSWISTTLKRQIITYKSFKNYEGCIQQSAMDFCEEIKAPYLHARYEDLIFYPARTIDQLNSHLETTLTLDDLKKVYHKPLYKSPRTSFDLVKAVLIYLKNYSSRAELVAAPLVRRT